MQIRILKFLILLLPFFSQGQQQYFNKRYDFDSRPSGGFDILPYDSGYIMWSSSLVPPGNNLKILVSFLDSAGNLLRTKIYNNPNGDSYMGGNGTICKTSDNGYANAGSIQYSLTNSNITLYKFDHNGDTLWTQEYGDTLYQSGWQCKQTRDGGFVITGQTCTYDPAGDVVLIKTDSLGNLQWQNHYGGDDYDIAVSIDTCFDGGYIMCGATESYGANANSTFPNCYVVKTDSLGNFQWQQVFGGIYEDAFWYVIQSSDRSIVTGGEFGSYDPYAHCCGGYTKPYLVKLDLSGDVIWQKTYGDSLTGTTLYSIKELPNSDIIGGGTANDPANYFADRGLVLRVRSNGDSVLYRKFAALSLESYSDIYDISYDKDNGFICTGDLSPSSPDTGTQDVWALKLDSNGCEVENCLTATGINELQPAQNRILNIYPNPSSGVFYLGYNILDEIEKTEVFNYIGEVIFFKEGRTEEINLSGSTSGIYFYSVRTKTGKVFDGKIVKY